MPIKWSAVKVTKAMDEVEYQFNLAEPFLAEAKAKAREAKNIANLPQYLDQRLCRLIDQIERMDNVKSAIKAVRNDLPASAIEAEKEKLKQGNQQSLI